MVEEGTQAPDFELPSDDGQTVRLSSLRGRPVVLYFYPKDDTAGCTRQACDLRDAYDAYTERDAVILGVSPDAESSHRRFKSKYGLPFTLLADTDHSVAEAYGVWVEKRNYGKTYYGINRSTFVLDREGTVVKALYGVKPDGHAELVLDALPA
jgi:peroxiredoxin Q/BCP